MINCPWASVIVSPHHILGGEHPGSGHAPSLGFVTALALWAPFPDMLGKTVSMPDMSLGWEQIPHHTLNVTPSVFAPHPHSSLSQREAASLCKFNIYQLVFLKKTCICRNLGQTTSIEPSEISNNENSGKLMDFPWHCQHVCLTTNQKMIFHLRKKNTFDHDIIVKNLGFHVLLQQILSVL